MLSRYDLREYRLMSGLALRDVARYCGVSAQLIGQVENGEKKITEYNHNEIVKGINTARQRKADDVFADDKAQERLEQVEKEKKSLLSSKKKPSKKNKKDNT